MFKNKTRILAWVIIGAAIVVTFIKTYDAQATGTLDEKLLGIVLWEFPAFFIGFYLYAISSRKKNGK